MMRYFVDSNGRYLGGWDSSGPYHGVEVKSAPDDARDIWNGEHWVRGDHLKTAEAHQYLLDTDYIAMKMAEVIATGGDTSALVKKYSQQIKAREEARAVIRTTEVAQ